MCNNSMIKQGMVCSFCDNEYDVVVISKGHNAQICVDCAARIIIDVYPNETIPSHDFLPVKTNV